MINWSLFTASEVVLRLFLWSCSSCKPVVLRPTSNFPRVICSGKATKFCEISTNYFSYCPRNFLYVSLIIVQGLQQQRYKSFNFKTFYIDWMNCETFDQVWFPFGKLFQKLKAKKNRCMNSYIHVSFHINCASQILSIEKISNTISAKSYYNTFIFSRLWTKRYAT